VQCRTDATGASDAWRSHTEDAIMTLFPPEENHLGQTRDEATMKLTVSRFFCLFLTGLCLWFAVDATTNGQQPNPRPSRSEYMRQKLDFSKQALEGLALEQFGLIEKNAKALRRLSEAAEWEVPTIPNATDYVALTTEFQRNADELAREARQRNIDAATLAYLKLTMTCVQCHKYVRFLSK
jgi:hypothetical protein